MPCPKDLEPNTYNSTFGYSWDPIGNISNPETLARFDTWLEHFQVQNENNTAIQDCNIWSSICEDTSAVFGSELGLAVCTLYPEVTRRIANGSLSPNLTRLGFDPSETSLISQLGYRIPACLMSYNAVIDPANSTTACLTDLMVRPDGYLSPHGVSNCWLEMCTGWKPVADKDLGGVGIVSSYLMQLCLAIIGAAFIGFPVVRRKYQSLSRGHRHRKASGQSFLGKPISNKDLALSPSKDHRRLDPPNLDPKEEESQKVWTKGLINFHKTQCYYSISLQIASLVALYGPSFQYKDLYDAFLLLIVSADGIVPIMLTFYTLMVIGHRNWYVTLLTGITIILSSITGYHLVRNEAAEAAWYEWNNDLTGQEWPTACGQNSPQSFCNWLRRAPSTYNGATWFKAGAISLDIMMVALFLWHLEPLLPLLSRSKYFPHRLTAAAATRTSTPSSRTSTTLIARRAISTLLHIVAALLLALFSILYFFFLIALFVGSDSPIDRSDWDFGQIVGILIWASVIFDIAVEKVGIMRYERQLRRRQEDREEDEGEKISGNRGSREDEEEEGGEEAALPIQRQTSSRGHGRRSDD